MAAEPVELGRKGVFYFPGRVNSGLISPNGKQGVLIDSGIDEDSGRRLLSGCQAKGIGISAILNTHGHSDHFSGNAIIVERTGAKVFAPETDSAIIRNPSLEPYFLWGMAAPPKEARNKFLQGTPCKVDELVSEGKFSAAGFELEAISLPGHSAGQTGYLFSKILFAGDAFFSGESLFKHKILFCSDVSSALASIGKLEALVKEGRVETIVPGHGEPASGNALAKTLGDNRASLEAASEAILSLFGGEPKTDQELLKEYSDREGTVLNFTQYVLHLTTFRAQLTHLQATGRASCKMSENRLVWEKS
ncbi:MAG: MBL fold metallo-hydrolase [archaeon]